MYVRPPADVLHRTDMLYVPPFCHELDNSRDIMAMCFRRLAGAGVGVLSIDLPGCGDSEGELEDFGWEEWKSSLVTSFRWLRQNSGRPISLCGMRLGAALALEIAHDCLPAPERIILLQPVVLGEEMMTQYLRLSVAFSGLRDAPDQRVTTTGLRERLLSGESLEVAGYILRPDLVAAIDGVNLNNFRPDPAIPIDWVETAHSRQSIELRQLGGVQTKLHQIAVKPYWLPTRGDAADYEALASVLIDILSDGR